MFSLRSVIKRYAAGGTEFCLTVPHLDIAGGAKLAFIGESGSGKSTLLELLAMILAPTETGHFRFSPDVGSGPLDVAAAWQNRDSDILADYRSRFIGYVLQSGGLLPYLSVRDNINLSRRLLGHDTGEAAEHWAARLGISGQLDKLPAALSIGQRQRVAIARALAHSPALLIADEPTASVDPLNAARIVELMVRLADDTGVTLIVASHAHRLMEGAGLTLVEHAISAVDDNTMHVTVGHGAA